MAAWLCAPLGAEMIWEWTGPVMSRHIPAPMNSLGYKTRWPFRNAIFSIYFICSPTRCCQTFTTYWCAFSNNMPPAKHNGLSLMHIDSFIIRVSEVNEGLLENARQVAVCDSVHCCPHPSPFGRYVFRLPPHQCTAAIIKRTFKKGRRV